MNRLPVWLVVLLQSTCLPDGLPALPVDEYIRLPVLLVVLLQSTCLPDGLPALPVDELTPSPAGSALAVKPQHYTIRKSPC